MSQNLHRVARTAVFVTALLSAFFVRAQGRRAESLLARGRWVDTRVELRREQAAGERAAFMQASCAAHLDTPEADEMLRDFIVDYPASLLGNDARLSLALLYCAEASDAVRQDSASYARASAALRQVDYRTLPPSDKEKYDLRMGYFAFLENDYDTADTHLRRIGSKSPYHDHALYYQAYIAYAKGDLDHARVLFAQLENSPAYAALAPYYLLQIEFRAGNHRYVVEHGERLLPLTVPEQQGLLHRLIAESWFRLEDFRKAVSHLLSYESSGSEMGRAEHYLLGFSYYALTRYADAATHLRAASGADDALTQNASYHLADCYLRSNDKRSAMQAFAMAAGTQYDPDIAEDALFNYGKLQFELGGGIFSEAIRVLTAYVERYPRSARTPTARELLAAAYYNTRNYEAAYQAIADSTDPALRPARQKIAYHRGLTAFQAGQYAPAERYLTEAMQLDVAPRYTTLSTYWLAELSYRAGDYPMALKRWEAVLARAPHNEAEYVMSWYNTGYALFSQEKMSAAQERFEGFLTRYKSADGYQKDARNRLADTYYAERNFSQALEIYTQTGDDYAQFQRAIVLGILARPAEKTALLERIVSAGQGEWVDDATWELGHTFIAREQYQKGVDVLTPFLEKYPHSPARPAALADLGLAWQNLGDAARSMSYYDQVVQAAPQSAAARDALLGIRDLYVQRGDADGYFAYAAQSGAEGDLGLQARDSLTFAAARRVYLSAKPETAAKSLRSYIESYPRGFYRADALFLLSDCYLKTDARSEAIETLQALVSTGESPYTTRALEALVRQTSAAGDSKTAADAAWRLVQREPTAAHWATYAKAAGNDPAMPERVIAAGAAAGAEATRIARSVRAKALGNTPEATRLYTELAKEPKTPEGAEASYRLIEAAWAAGDGGRTEKLVFSLADSGTTQSLWLARAYLILGDRYLKAGDTFQARATWQSIVDGYAVSDDGVIAAARERIEKLK